MQYSFERTHPKRFTSNQKNYQETIKRSKRRSNFFFFYFFIYLFIFFYFHYFLFYHFLNFNFYHFLNFNFNFNFYFFYFFQYFFFFLFLFVIFFKKKIKKKLQKYGDKPAQSKSGQGWLLLQLINNFTINFRSAITGLTAENVDTQQLNGGARIRYIFNEIFSKSLDEMNPLDGLILFFFIFFLFFFIL